MLSGTFVTVMCLCMQQDEEELEEPGKTEDFGEGGGRTRGTRRGGTTRGRTTRRGISRYRKTDRKPRSTVRSSRGSQRLTEEGGIPLTEIQT